MFDFRLFSCVDCCDEVSDGFLFEVGIVWGLCLIKFL